MRLSLIVIIIILATALNNVSEAFNLLGDIFEVILGFVLPTVIYYNFFYWKLTKSK